MVGSSLGNRRGSVGSAGCYPWPRGIKESLCRPSGVALLLFWRQAYGAKRKARKRLRNGKDTHPRKKVDSKGQVMTGSLALL